MFRVLFLVFPLLGSHWKTLNKESIFVSKVLHWSSFRIALCQWKYLNGTGCNLWNLRLNLSFPPKFCIVFAPFRFHRCLVAGSSNLRGDGGNYVDTVHCTGSGTLPTQPVLSSNSPTTRDLLILFFFGLLPGSSVLSFAAFGLKPTSGVLQRQHLTGDLWHWSGKLWWQLVKDPFRVDFCTKKRQVQVDVWWGTGTVEMFGKVQNTHQ